MTLNVDGAGKHFTEAQLNALKTVMNDDAEAQKLLDLFGTEDNEVAGFADEARDILGLNAEMITKISGADKVFKGLLDGSLTIEKLEENNKAQETAAGTDNSNKTGSVKTREEVEKLDAEVTALKNEIDKLDNDITAQKAALEEKKKLLEEKKQELEEANEVLKAEQAELNEIKANITAKEKERKETEELITEKQNLLMTRAEQTQKETVDRAKADYNKETDGDWNAYLMKKLGALGVDVGISSEISQLTNKLTGINTALDGLNNKFAAQQTVVNAAAQKVGALEGEVNALNDDIASIQTDIETKEAAKITKQKEYDTKLSELENAKAAVVVKDPSAANGIVPDGNDSIKTQDDIKNMIPEKEFALVEKYGVDLGEKLKDGSPRYVFAEGKDGNYHIYDMGNGRQGATLARLYEPGNGYDVVPSGSGYLNNFQEVSEGNGRTVYYFCGDNVKELQGCYSTSSPLSFDLNGDGVKTSNEIVEFDIDGDGITDKINDSADAVLVFDKDGDGISGEDGSECFGDNTDIDGDGVKDGYKDGFEALKAFARDKGLINDADDMVLDADDIKFLEENFGFGLKTEGYNSEAKSLTDLGITEINLANTNETTLEDNFDGNGNQLMKQEGATFVQNGETKDYADIWHRKLEENTVTDKTVNKTAAASGAAKNINVELDEIIANFDAGAAINTFSIKPNLAFDFTNVNVDAPDSQEDKDKKDKKKIDGNQDVN